MNPPDLADDATLVSECLAGNAAALQRFHEEFRLPITAYLAKVGAERADAAELAASFLNECLFPHGSKSPRLEKWAARSPLSAWLRRGARNYFLDHVRKRSREVPIDQTGDAPTERDEDLPISQKASKREARELLAEALRHGREAVSAEGYVLAYLACHGIKQGLLARMLGYSDSKISRKIAACLQKIKSETLAYIANVDPEFHFSWSDLSEIASDFLEGRPDNEPEPGNDDISLGEC